MARPLRIECVGALYQVTLRGDGREAISVWRTGSICTTLRRSTWWPRLSTPGLFRGAGGFGCRCASSRRT